MMKIIAVLCSLSAPSDCHDETVSTDIAMQSCLIGMPQLAEWMGREHPNERLESWKCVVGERREGI